VAVVITPPNFVAKIGIGIFEIFGNIASGDGTVENYVDAGLLTVPGAKGVRNATKTVGIAIGGLKSVPDPIPVAKPQQVKPVVAVSPPKPAAVPKMESTAPPVAPASGAASRTPAEILNPGGSPPVAPATPAPNFVGPPAPKKIPNIESIGKQATDWIGKDAKVITNEFGDTIIQSKDGLREIRFDFNHTAPHANPHTHLIEYKMVKNKKVEVVNKRIYPDGVPPE